jgi:hypothetical protein
MANRYWVGGTGNWNDTARWAATSGGAGGETVPTSADNAYFDGNSDAGTPFTVTVNVSASCKDLIIGDGVTVTTLDQAMTLTGSSSLTIHGSWFNPATNYTRVYSGSITFAATTLGNIITTNGVTITNSGSLSFFGVGGEWILGSSFTTTASTQINTTNGILRTNNYNFTVGSFTSDGTGPREIYFGSSTVTLLAGGMRVGFNTGTATNLTVDFGTSTIICPGPTSNAIGLGNSEKTFTPYNMSFSIGINIFTGAFNVSNNFVIAAGQRTLVGINMTIGNLSVAAGNTNILTRSQITSDTAGVVRTLTCGTATFGAGVDFQAITAAGASAPWNVSTFGGGDAGGNTNITFPAPKTVYWNLAGTQNWSSTGWATTPTGTPAVANFPLAQDTAVITELGAGGTISTEDRGWFIGNLICDDGVNPRTSALTISMAFNNTPRICGNIVLSSGIISAGVQGFRISRFSGVQTIRSNGKAVTWGLSKESNSTLQFLDNFTSANSLGPGPSGGRIDLNSQIVSVLTAGLDGVWPSLDFGTTGILRITGNNGFVFNGTGAITPTPGIPNTTGSKRVELTYTGSTGTRQVELGRFGGVSDVNIFVLGGTDVFGGATNVSCRSINLTGFSGAYALASLQVTENATFSPTMTINTVNNPAISFIGSGAQSFTSAGLLCELPITLNGAGTLTLQDNLTMGATRRFTHTTGGVNLNGRVLTCNNWLSSNSNPRSLTFGAGQIILTGTGEVWGVATATNYTITPGTGKIVLSNNTNTARSFSGGGITTYPELEFGGDTGTATTTITGANGFAKLSSTKLVAYTIVFPNVETRVANWNLNGSAGNLITLSRTGGSGVFTIRYTGGAFALGRYLSISNSTALPINRMYAIYSTNGGGNTNWTFDSPKFAQFINFFDIV